MAAQILLRASSKGALSRLVSPLWSSPTTTLPSCTALANSSVLSSQHVREFRGKSRFSMPDDWNKPHGLKPSQHWAIERYLATALIPGIPLAFFFPNPYLEYLLTAGIVLHAHWGVDGIVMDYLHRRILPPKLCEIAVLLMSATAFGCLCYFNYSDIGVINAVKALWTL